jgi:hypothetical protein
MPWLNRVLEELRIHHEEHSVPPEVLSTIEEKKTKATAKNATVAAKSKKRKGVGAFKVVAKKQKTAITAVASAVSVASFASGSVRVSANAKEFLAENTSGVPTKVTAEAEKSNAAEDIGGQRMEAWII